MVMVRVTPARLCALPSGRSEVLCWPIGVRGLWGLLGLACDARGARSVNNKSSFHVCSGVFFEVFVFQKCRVKRAIVG